MGMPQSVLPPSPQSDKPIAMPVYDRQEVGRPARSNTPLSSAQQQSQEQAMMQAKMQATLAQQQGMPLSQQGMGQIGGYNPPPPPNMAQYDAMQNQYAQNRSNFFAQNPALTPQQGGYQRQALMAQQFLPAMQAQQGMPPYMQQRMGQNNPNRLPQVAQAAQGGMGGKGGQPPSPQQLGQGLERQAAMNRAMGKGSQPPAPQNFGGNNQFGGQRGGFNNFNNRFDNYGGGGRGNFGGGYGGGMGQRGFRR